MLELDLNSAGSVLELVQLNLAPSPLSKAALEDPRAVCEEVCTRQ